ncbi:acyl-CoA dehydrogenase family protein [Massilia cavernae]|uniref:Acyl-CoA dehydrogenase n=1 Tax=Massilia cavernae TaxID=2320864 RepID=A0A418Y0P5_9BURK|nr:acyl-CoA dehydrogenase family protein [Massilia cavernae]RJG18850.1 acyl-CoA dehydrogenase [Massilia cavernae]
MDLNWSDAELAFRDEVRVFLQHHLNDDLRAAGRHMTSIYGEYEGALAWQRILHGRGWAAPNWPLEHGGCGWSVTQRYIFARERLAAGAPPVTMALQMIGPALIEFGTPDQKARFLPKTLSGEYFWCQGYSEPDAGSDLASLQMRADADGDDFVCNGAKIWTTHADVANWIFCLVRTEKRERPQQGITFLLIDMASPGISVRPIVAPSGEHIQNQVFFDNVRVPRANVVGKIGEGWTVAKFLLEFERGGTAYAPELQVRLDRIAEFAAGAPADDGAMLADDPAYARKIAAARIRIGALELYEFRAMRDDTGRHSPGLAASVMKVLGTELSQHLTELALEAAGHYGIAYQPQATRPGGPAQFPHGAGAHAGPRFAAIAPLHYLNDRASTIYGGSNEIQRNIIAKAGLGL